MEVCQNWGSEGCHPGISKWKSIREKRDRGRIQFYRARKKTDKICKNCKGFSLSGCPDCNSKNVVEMTRVEIKKDKKMTTFVCENCDFVLQKPD